MHKRRKNSILGNIVGIIITLVIFLIGGLFGWAGVIVATLSGLLFACYMYYKADDLNSSIIFAIALVIFCIAFLGKCTRDSVRHGDGYNELQYEEWRKNNPNA